MEDLYLGKRQDLVRFLGQRGAGDLAEDMAQDIWVKLLASPTKITQDAAGYLYRSASNMLIDEYRSRRFREGREELWRHRWAPQQTPVDGRLLAKDQIEAAEKCLQALGERIFRIFVMFKLNGVPQRDIAEKLGVSVSTVERDVRRAYDAIAALDAETGAD